MLVNTPVVVSARNNLLTLPEKLEETRRLYKTLKLIICKVSGVVSDAQDFRNKLHQSFVHHGDQAPRNGTQLTSNDGTGMHTGETLVRFHCL